MATANIVWIGDKAYSANHPLAKQSLRPATQARGSVAAGPMARAGDCSGRALPVLNKTETRWRDVLISRQYQPVWEQSFTLALDPPYKSYRPDLAVLENGKLVFWEVKAPHRFREKGVAKAALAAKTYPGLCFKLADWTEHGWKVTVLSS